MKKYKSKKNDVIWKGYPESYPDSELWAFGEKIKGVSMREAEFMFGARNHRGEIIITMQNEGGIEKYVRPYPIEIFEHKYEAYSKMVVKKEFVEEKKVEGLEQLAKEVDFSKE